MGLWCCDIADGRGFGLTADPETKAALQRHVEIQKYLTHEEKEWKRIFNALLLGTWFIDACDAPLTIVQVAEARESRL